MTKQIYIYAFPGMGKTTLCKQYGYVDYDKYVSTKPEINNSIILTNDINLPCRIYFIPPTYEIGFNRLHKKKQSFFNEYIGTLRHEYELVKKQPNTIITDYITNELIERMLKNENIY